MPLGGQRLLDARQQHDAPGGPGQRGHEQSMIFTGVEGGDGGAGIAAHAIGGQPFPADQAGEIQVRNLNPIVHASSMMR